MSDDKLSPSEEAKLIEEIRDEFKFSYEGEEAQRKEETEDLQMQVPELQWTAEAAASRKGGDQNGVKVFPRPMLSINKIDQPARIVMTQARQAQLGVNIHPVSETATDDTAQMLQDLYRRIERDSNAAVARLWALDRAVKAGRGVYRIDVKPDDDGFDYGDLEICIERILHQSSVYLDPSAQKPDWSDGDFAYVTSWMLLSKAERLFPGSVAKLARGSTLEFQGMSERAPLWTKNDGKVKSIQIAERFWKKHTDELLLLLDNGVWIKDGDKQPKGRKVVSERVRDNCEVWWAKTNGFELLEAPKKWLGRFIPLVPVLGRELQPFDELRRIKGLFRDARDPQRFYNTSASTLFERMMAEPRNPWVMVEGQDEGREREWAMANYLSVPVLKVKPVMMADGTTPAPLPVRTQLDQTGMSIALMALQEAGTMVQDVTAFFDPSLGKGAARDESGKHALALQGQGDAANGDWLDQLAIAMFYEARAVVDLIMSQQDSPGVYDAQGRVTTVLSGEPAKARKVMLNAPYIVDKTTGVPKKVRPGTDGAKMHDLRSGARYGFNINIGTSYKTRLQEGDEALTSIVQAAPELLMIIGDILFSFKDIPGSKEISERLRMLIEGQHPELFANDDSPEQAATKAKALQGQVQQLTQQLQQASQALATDQAKHQAAVQIEQFKQMASVHIAEMNNAAKIEIARITAAKDTLNVEASNKEELLATGLKVQAEADANALQQEHERRMQQHDHAHEVGMIAGTSGPSRTVEQGQNTNQEKSQEHNTSPVPHADGATE